MKKGKNAKQFLTLHSRIILCLLLVFTGIHILSWNLKAFTDWYRLTIFPVWTGTLGRISGLFQGSVGEILIAAGICLLFLQVLLLPVYVWEWITRVRQPGHGQAYMESKQHEQGQISVEDRDHGSKQAFVEADNVDAQRQQKHRKGWKVRRLKRWNKKVICWIFIYIYGTETLNCYVLYHASTIEEQYFYNEAAYGTQELIEAYKEVVAQANVLSGQVKRDARGQAVYDGTTGELYAACRKAMQAQGGKYPYLAGYYPDPKPIRASNFMSQQYLLGIYFPFTMEANYNAVMYPLNVPVTVCHEYAHLKGMILEDEANFLGFAACIESGDPYLQYSGYLSVLGYLAGQIRKSVPEETRRQLEQANDQVVMDDAFLTKEQWEQVEEKAVLPTETVNRATDVFLETNLTMNGVADGIQSYSRVVRLVISYYQEQ